MRHDLILSSLLIPAAAIVAPAAHASDYLTVAQAQRALFPQADTFHARSVDISPDQRKAIRRRSGTRQRGDVQRAWRATRAGETVGWMLVDDVIGKHEFITYAVAISPDGRVLGLEVLSYRETHGGEIRDASWRDQFTGKTVDDRLRLGKDIANISGATLSCRNVTDGVKRLLVIWDLLLDHAS